MIRSTNWSYDYAVTMLRSARDRTMQTVVSLSASTGEMTPQLKQQLHEAEADRHVAMQLLRMNASQHAGSIDLLV